ncbi:hypothetical protein BC827DRAFT_1272484 [Russula dissimulans]|nr:hypothetical protein BC827DRAFT_1272484 [Russula dissimulans]
MVQFTNVLMALLVASATSALPLQKRISQTIADSTTLWVQACEKAGGGGQCNTISQAAFSTLLAAAGNCDQQDAADKMVDLAKTLNNDADMIRLAQIFVQQSRNAPDGLQVPYCQTAPKNTELNGFFHCQFAGSDFTKFSGDQTGNLPLGVSAVNPPGSCPALDKPVPDGVQLNTLVSSPGTPIGGGSNSSNVARDVPSGTINFTTLTNDTDVSLNGTSPVTCGGDNSSCVGNPTDTTSDTSLLDNTALPYSDSDSTPATNTSLLGSTIASNSTTTNTTSLDNLTDLLGSIIASFLNSATTNTPSLGNLTDLLGTIASYLNSTNSNAATGSPSNLTDLLTNTTESSDSSGTPYDTTSYLSTDSDPSQARSPTDSFVPGSAFRRRAAQQKGTPAKDLKVNESKSKSKNGKDKSKDGKAKAENEKAKAKGGKAKSKQSKAAKP